MAEFSNSNTVIVAAGENLPLTGESPCLHHAP